MKDLAVSVLTLAGHEVKVSDLYAMKFKAVADQNDFLELSNPDFFKYQTEQRFAYDQSKFSPDIIAEQEKLLWADFVLIQFPLWWFSIPAILKGWVDRVFTVGFAYGGNKMYDNGGLKGRKAMLALTTGGSPTNYSPNGINGDIEQLLFHIHHGMLYFVGMEVLPPFIAWGPARVGQEKREQYLQEYEKRLLSIETTPVIPFRSLSDYDENLILKPDIHFSASVINTEKL
jgi:NAD(P)H dehydrogenase (quinone)